MRPLLYPALPALLQAELGRKAHEAASEACSGSITRVRILQLLACYLRDHSHNRTGHGSRCGVSTVVGPVVLWKLRPEPQEVHLWDDQGRR